MLVLFQKVIFGKFFCIILQIGIVSIVDHQTKSSIGRVKNRKNKPKNFGTEIVKVFFSIRGVEIFCYHRPFTRD